MICRPNNVSANNLPESPFSASAEATPVASQSDSDLTELGTSLENEIVASSTTNVDDVETCYGTMSDIAIRFFQGKNGPNLSRTMGNPTSYYLRFGTRGTTVVENGAEIAVFNISDGRLLKNLASAFDVRLDLQLKGGNGSRNGKLRSEKIVLLDINLFGHVQDVKSLGDFLSDRGVFLQEPSNLPLETRYRNPHVFTTCNDSETPFFFREKSNQRSRFEKEIEAIMKMSTDFLEPHSFTQDPCIVSPLRQHQIFALQFMTDMEKEIRYHSSTCLWNYSELTGRLRHKITFQSTENNPREARGGLLADEMGLGKTLSMLSLIIRTLSEARNFSDMSSFGQRIGTTLIVTPKTTIQNWVSEISRHIAPNSIRFQVYHGDTINLANTRIKEYDVVITTYETLVSKLKSGTNDFGSCTWFRIVLDEAHTIRNTSTQTFNLIHQLNAERRWCLTGTPIQNSLKDLFALTKFLRLSPFDEDSVIRRHILQPLVDMDRRGLDNLSLLIRSFSLRRTKDLCNMASRHEREVAVNFSESERHHYDTIRNEGRRRLMEVVKSQVSESGRVIFQTIGRLRQFCSYGQGIVSEGPAGHKKHYPTKLLTVLSHILELDRLSLFAGLSPTKSLIFSFFRTTLDVMQDLLARHNIGYLRIDGSYELDQRKTIINEFQTIPTKKVMLLTLGTGSVGLNLAAASHVHILEPHWNPMVEEQAAARVHRLDQKNEVFIYRYIVKDSIEENVKNLQRRKRWYASLSQEQDEDTLMAEEMKELGKSVDLSRATTAVLWVVSAFLFGTLMLRTSMRDSHWWKDLASKYFPDQGGLHETCSPPIERCISLCLRPLSLQDPVPEGSLADPSSIALALL
ncbi:MAG: hypothetical protein Q9167_000800 [Letrouitia subvulpina]